MLKLMLAVLPAIGPLSALMGMTMGALFMQSDRRVPYLLQIGIMSAFIGAMLHPLGQVIGDYSEMPALQQFASFGTVLLAFAAAGMITTVWTIQAAEAIARSLRWWSDNHLRRRSTIR